MQINKSFLRNKGEEILGEFAGCFLQYKIK